MGCNHLDDVSSQYVYRPGAEFNFLSVTAKRLFHWDVLRFLEKPTVEAYMKMEMKKYPQLQLSDYSDFIDGSGDPHVKIYSEWKDEFEVCFQELVD